MPGTITPIGVFTAPIYPTLATTGEDLAMLVDPGDTNEPIMFEPPPILTAGTHEVWLIASGGPDWGGCQVKVSTDGTTYALAGIIYRGARQGLLTATLANHADPDLTNTLSVDLTESEGQLLSATQDDADNFVTLCYCDGELVSYETATLTAAFKYDLTYLRRGVYATPISSHAIGSAFARFGPNDPAPLRYIYPANFVNQTIFVKLPSFNTFGQMLQSDAAATVYSYAPNGAGQNPAANPIVQTLNAGGNVDLNLAAGVLDLNVGGGTAGSPTEFTIDLGVV
jgi:hypothetical protein